MTPRRSHLLLTGLALISIAAGVLILRFLPAPPRPPARVAAPIAAMLLAVGAGVWIFAGWERLASPGFGALLVVVLLYGLFWAALAAAVDGLGRSSAFNALTLLGAWVAITMILPAAPTGDEGPTERREADRFVDEVDR